MSLHFKVYVVEDEHETIEKTLEFENVEAVTIEKVKELAFGLPVTEKDELHYAYPSENTTNVSWSIPITLDWTVVKALTDLDNFRNGVFVRLQRKTKKKKDKERNTKQLGLFGLEVEELLQKQRVAHLKGSHFPIILVQAITWLRGNNRIKEEGLFRISPNNQELSQLKELYDQHGSVDLTSIPDLNVHCVAGVIKSFFRELPSPVVPYKSYHDLLTITKSSADPKQQAMKMAAIINDFPKLNRDILLYTLKFLKEVSLHSDINKMSPTNLSVCLAPNLLREAPTSDSSKASNQFAEITYINSVLTTLIEQYDALKYMEIQIEADKPKRVSREFSPTLQELRSGKKTGGHVIEVESEAQKKLAKAMLLANVSALRKTSQQDKPVAAVHSFDNLPIQKSPVLDTRKVTSLNTAQTAIVNKQFKWACTVLDSDRFGLLFVKLDVNKTGLINRETSMPTLLSCGPIDNVTITKIWTLADRDGDQHLDKKEFTIAMFLVEALKVKSQIIPDELPTDLVTSVYRGMPSGPNVGNVQLKPVHRAAVPSPQKRPEEVYSNQQDFRSVLKKDNKGATSVSTPAAASSNSQNQVDFRSMLKPSSSASLRRFSLPDASPNAIRLSNPQQLKEELDREEEQLRREEEELQRQEAALLAQLGNTNDLPPLPPPPTVAVDLLSLPLPPPPILIITEEQQGQL